MWRVFLAGGWTLLVLLAIWFVRRDALKYLDWSPTTYGRFWPQRGLLSVHIVGAGVALLLGPFQFVRALRTRWPRVHRFAGWAYAIAVLGSTPIAIRLSTHSSCPLCVSPFVVWGLVTTAVTLIALVTAVKGRYRLHRDFMVRSYALMYGFVFVRLDTHLLGTFLEVPLAEGVARNSMVLWLAWVLPLLAAEVVISWIPALRRTFRESAKA